MKIRGWRIVPVEATEAMLTHGSMFEQQYHGCVSAAPDPLQDEQMVEMVARTAYEDMRAPHEWNWPNEDEHIRAGYTGTARAVLALFRGEQP